MESAPGVDPRIASGTDDLEVGAARRPTWGSSRGGLVEPGRGRRRSRPRARGSTRLSDILGARARAVLRPGGDDNDILVEADHNGEDLNGVTIALVDDGSVHEGGERAVYDDVTRTLTVYVDDGRTTGRQVADAINNAHDLDAEPCPSRPAWTRSDDVRGERGGSSAARLPRYVTHDGSGDDFDRTSGLQIVNGLYSETIASRRPSPSKTFSTRSNGADIGVSGRHQQDGTGGSRADHPERRRFLDRENGGQSATQLGIRTSSPIRRSNPQLRPGRGNRARR